jgi:hypothetical protein
MKEDDCMARKGNQAKQAGKIIDFNPQEIAGRVTRFGERMLSIREDTVPDAFRRMPKVISPRVHAWLDLAVTTYFAGLGAWFATRRKGGAAIAAFVNAAMVGGVSLMTDYDGNGRKPINFKMHGTLDALQAATAAAGPFLHGFADEPKSAFFYGQAANEVAVIGLTDWDAGMPSRRRRKAA